MPETVESYGHRALKEIARSLMMEQHSNLLQPEDLTPLVIKYQASGTYMYLYSGLCAFYTTTLYLGAQGPGRGKV